MDYKRLTQVLRWNTTAYRGELSRFFGQGVAAFGILTLATNASNWFCQESTQGSIYSEAKFCGICIIIMLFVSAANVCFNMKTKTDRISYSMLPATKLEKFLANVIYQSVVVLVLAFAGLIAVDIVQAVISLLTTHEAYSLTWAVLKTSANFDDGNPSSRMIVIGFGLPLMLHATYVLGGTFFRKHNFLYTSIIIVTVPFVLSLIIGGITAGIMGLTYYHGYEVEMEWLLSEGWTTVLIAVLFIAVSALFYWMAYHCFRRINVINNKNHN